MCVCASAHVHSRCVHSRYHRYNRYDSYDRVTDYTILANLLHCTPSGGATTAADGGGATAAITGRAAVAACTAAAGMAGDGVNYLVEGTLHRPVGRPDQDLLPQGGWVSGSVPILRTIGNLCGNGRVTACRCWRPCSSTALHPVRGGVRCPTACSCVEFGGRRARSVADRPGPRIAKPEEQSHSGLSHQHAC